MMTPGPVLGLWICLAGAAVLVLPVEMDEKKYDMSPQHGS